MSREHRVNFRLGEAGFKWLDNLRLAHDVHLADVVRAAMSVAARHNAEVIAILRTLKETQ